MEYVFACLKMNILFKKSPENAPFTDVASKARGINKCCDLAVVCPPYQNSWLRAWMAPMTKLKCVFFPIFMYCSTTRLIRQFVWFVTFIFCVHFCSCNSPSSDSSIRSIRHLFLSLRKVLFGQCVIRSSAYDVYAASTCGNSNKLRIFICELFHLAICLSNLCTRCEARPDSPLKERVKSFSFLKI